jgi:cold shock CspA family protein
VGWRADRSVSRANRRIDLPAPSARAGAKRRHCALVTQPQIKNRNDQHEDCVPDEERQGSALVNPAKGFGFIEPDSGGPDVFVHISAVGRAGMSGLNEGQKVSFDVQADRAAASHLRKI